MEKDPTSGSVRHGRCLLKRLWAVVVAVSVLVIMILVYSGSSFKDEIKPADILEDYNSPMVLVEVLGKKTTQDQPFYRKPLNIIRNFFKPDNTRSEINSYRTINTTGSRLKLNPFDRQISIESAFNIFRHKTSAECKNECNLPSHFCGAKTVEAWRSHDKLKERFELIPLFSENEHIFPWEKEYLRYPRLQDLKTLPDEKRSDIVAIINGKSSQSRELVGNIGQSLVFRLDLYDAYGVSRNFGGDEVRAWISEHGAFKSKVKYTKDTGYSATGMVTDLKNGSYLVTVTPLWTGKIQINVAVVYPREYIRCAVHNYHLGVYYYLMGKFKNGSIEEVTLCSPTPNLPGRPCLCNLTDVNFVPYFCGRPLDNRLTCGHLVGMLPTETVSYKNMTPAEANLARRMSRTLETAMVQNDIVINVNKTENPTKLKACPKTDFSYSWSKHAPKGLWSEGFHWTNMVCKEREFNQSDVENCFANHTVYVIGDSNGRALYKAFVQRLNTTQVKPLKYPYVFHSQDVRNNITLKFRRHEHPFVFHRHWAPFSQHTPVGPDIDSIPSHGKYVVIAHYYVHISLYHLSTMYYRLKALKDSLARLVKRNSNGIIALRGPHTSTVEWQRNHMYSMDPQGKFMRTMVREVFKDIQQHVLFLDGWEKTIAIANPLNHPHTSVPSSMVSTIFAHYCS